MSNGEFGSQNFKERLSKLRGTQANSSKDRPDDARAVRSMRLKHQLALYLERRDITAAQLARKTGLPKALFTRWLSGQKPKDIDQVKKVAEALNVSLEHLLYGNGIEERPDSIGDLGALLGSDWVGGTFELRIRRVKKDGKD